MTFLKTGLILVLAPVVGFSATLISHSRTASADVTLVSGGTFTDSDSTLLDGFAFLEAGVNPTPAAAASELESVISSDRFEVTNARATVSNKDSSVLAGGNAFAGLKVDFQLNGPEIWLLDLFFDGFYAGFRESGGVQATAILTNLTLSETIVYWALFDEPLSDGPPLTKTEKFLLTPGQYRLEHYVIAAGSSELGFNVFEGMVNSTFLMEQVPIPEPTTYFGVSAALAAFLLARRQLGKS